MYIKMAFIFGSAKKLSLSDQLGQLTSDFRKKRDIMMTKLIPQAYETLKAELVLSAGKQTKSTTILDLTQFHNRAVPSLDDEEKLELSNGVAKLFDKESLNVLRNTSADSPWLSLTLTWAVPEEVSDEEVEEVQVECEDKLIKSE
jgi:hypothetical protein